VVEALDRVYGAEGRLVSLRLELLGARPAGEAAWKTRWLHVFPLDYEGEVWIQVVLRPRGARRDSTHVIRLSWGLWRRDVTVWIDSPEGEAFAFAKGHDDVSIPLRVTLDAPGIVAFHAAPAPRGAIDINEGWVGGG
jgi:hypothetical protein